MTLFEHANLDYFVFDFETANGDPGSICQIGLASIVGGQLHQTACINVNPETHFEEQNIMIHGIEPEDVMNAPTISQAFEPLEDLFRQNIAISHSKFDKTGIENAYSKLPRICPLDVHVDSMRVVRRAWPTEFGKTGYGLKNLAKHFDIEFAHHNAGEDARATALIMQHAINHSGVDARGWVTKSQSRTVSEIYASKAVKIEGNADGALAGNIAVFTGEITIKRADAAKMAAEVGITVGASVTKKTTLLIVGEQDLQALAGHKKSGKHRKAEKYISEGQNIRIMGENEFRELVEKNRSSH